MKYFIDELNNQRVLVNLTKGPGLCSTLHFIDHHREEFKITVPAPKVAKTLSLYNRLPRTGSEIEGLAKEIINHWAEKRAW